MNRVYSIYCFFLIISPLISSTKCDDFFVIHIPSEFDNVMESVFKTELITLLR